MFATQCSNPARIKTATHKKTASVPKIFGSFLKVPTAMDIRIPQKIARMNVLNRLSDNFSSTAGATTSFNFPARRV